jgi:hypothetical protein
MPVMQGTVPAHMPVTRLPGGALRTSRRRACWRSDNLRRAIRWIPGGNRQPVGSREQRVLTSAGSLQAQGRSSRRPTPGGPRNTSISPPGLMASQRDPAGTAVSVSPPPGQRTRIPVNGSVAPNRTRALSCDQ